uniref:Uncharacterized protein n=1 Tax=Faecalibaculum rodentium TaxID=1702221 RepID=A0A140DYH0_9FIRM|nr:hypothetical protein AALO17_25630 [Faecalibaculum rodentium]
MLSACSECTVQDTKPKGIQILVFLMQERLSVSECLCLLK